MTVPQWMVPHVRQLFAIPTHLTPAERLTLLQTAVNLRAGLRRGRDRQLSRREHRVSRAVPRRCAAASSMPSTRGTTNRWAARVCATPGASSAPTRRRSSASIVTHRGTSVEVARRDGPLACELLFIDGDHHHPSGRSADLCRPGCRSLKPGAIPRDARHRPPRRPAAAFDDRSSARRACTSRRR